MVLVRLRPHGVVLEAGPDADVSSASRHDADGPLVEDPRRAERLRAVGLGQVRRLGDEVARTQAELREGAEALPARREADEGKPLDAKAAAVGVGVEVGVPDARVIEHEAEAHVVAEGAHDEDRLGGAEHAAARRVVGLVADVARVVRVAAGAAEARAEGEPEDEAAAVVVRRRELGHGRDGVRPSEPPRRRPPARAARTTIAGVSTGPR